jgi:hypothetical protein
MTKREKEYAADVAVNQAGQTRAQAYARHLQRRRAEIDHVIRTRTGSARDALERERGEIEAELRRIETAAAAK